MINLINYIEKQLEKQFLEYEKSIKREEEAKEKKRKTKKKKRKY